MLTRRTLTSVTLIAAIAGGSAGGVASVVTNPPAASAQVNSIGRTPASPTTIQGVGQFVNNINHSLTKRVIPQMAAQSGQIAALTVVVARIQAQMAQAGVQLAAIDTNVVNALRGQRVSDGRSIANVLMTIEAQTKP